MWGCVCVRVRACEQRRKSIIISFAGCGGGGGDDNERVSHTDWRHKEYKLQTIVIAFMWNENAIAVCQYAVRWATISQSMAALKSSREFTEFIWKLWSVHNTNGSSNSYIYIAHEPIEIELKIEEILDWTREKWNRIGFDDIHKLSIPRCCFPLTTLRPNAAGIKKKNGNCN